MKLTKRKAFNFLRSYFDVVNKLQTDSDKLAFLMAIINKQFLNEDPEELQFPVDLAYESQINAIETSVKGWIRACKTDLQGNSLDTPPTPHKGKTTNTPKEEEVQVEVQEKGKVEVQEKEEGKGGLQLRKTNFGKILAPFNSEIDKSDLVEFYEYWTEHGINDRKMRFEKEKSFDVSRRLKTWMRRKIEFASEKKRDTRIHVDEAIENIKSGKTKQKTEWEWNNPKQINQ